MSTGPAKKPCSVKDCSKNAFSLGLCTLHYSRLRRGQSLDETKPVPIVEPRRVVVVLPDALYSRIAHQAEKKDKAASTLIRELLEKAIP